MRQKSIVLLVALAIAFAAGCAHKANDAALVTSIKAQMFSDPKLKDADLQVTSSNGEVTLSGSVPDDAAHLDAYKIASQTVGVVRVNDKISINEAIATPPPPPSQAPPPQPKPLPVAKPHASHKHEKQRLERATQTPPPDQDTETAQNNAPPPPPDQNQSDDASTAQPSPVPAPAPASAPQAAPAPPPSQPVQLQVPAGSTITIRMIDSVDSSVNQPGEIFHASLDQPLVVGDRVAVPKGADVYVRLTSANTAGRVTGTSELRLELVKLEFQGQSYPLVSSTYSLNGASRGKDTAKKVGVGAVLGTLIGAIAGGGRGAAIGAGVGAAGGGVYQGSTHGQQVRIPSETKLDFQLEQPVSVTVMPPMNSR
ncbi:MAG: BON domain-containing protein [Candidatus Acidiferrales bacterium]